MVDALRNSLGTTETWSTMLYNDVVDALRNSLRIPQSCTLLWRDNDEYCSWCVVAESTVALYCGETTMNTVHGVLELNQRKYSLKSILYDDLVDALRNSLRIPQSCALLWRDNDEYCSWCVVAESTSANKLTVLCSAVVTQLEILQWRVYNDVVDAIDNPLRTPRAVLCCGDPMRKPIKNSSANKLTVLCSAVVTQLEILQWRVYNDVVDAIDNPLRTPRAELCCGDPMRKPVYNDVVDAIDNPLRTPRAVLCCGDPMRKPVCNDVVDAIDNPLGTPRAVLCCGDPMRKPVYNDVVDAIDNPLEHPELCSAAVTQ
ncbi:hypothetical protein J6590_076086 [Homalodisca vitripennis]|nr:hypothetical protein J6590_076086 [Homalodisca vitripennis]